MEKCSSPLIIDPEIQISPWILSAYLRKSMNNTTIKSRVKQSGLLSSGGLGFTIGTEKRKDQYSDADLLQKASTVGSVSGNVSIESGNKVEIGASAVLAGYED